MSGLDMREEMREAFGLETVMPEVLGRSFLAGRLEGRVREVGMDSGIGSDMVGSLIWRSVLMWWLMAFLCW